MSVKLELLAPAKDFESGKAAINCGADAVYIGASRFGARAAAGNSVRDIALLAGYAHKFRAKVYVTINTLLYDNELENARLLIHELYNAGADAIIVQDFSILTMDIPPIPLFASTQTNNTTAEKVKFLESAGFSRVILARELSLGMIKEIRKNTSIDLEFFVHGALCVCYSGQCYFSFAATGRSANRGECSQSCRMLYDLVDSKGKVIVKDKYLLSLKDLNLSLYLNDLIDAGITSFKIEGRLKDINYVKNATAYYRGRIDDLLKDRRGLSKASSGKVKLFFTPDLEKSFNRGYTDYFINDTNSSLSSFDTPKSIGKKIGTVLRSGKDFIEIESVEKLSNGDGICYFDKGVLNGFLVNRTEGKKVFPNEPRQIKKGTELYRNNDHAFEMQLAGKYAERKIEASIALSERAGKIFVAAEDEDGCRIEFEWNGEKQPAEKPDKAVAAIVSQLSKSGESIFEITNVSVNLAAPYFFPLSILNELRRTVVVKLEAERERTRPKETRRLPADKIILDKCSFDYRGNITNRKAEEFFGGAGAAEIEKGLELQHDFTGKVLMTCKYCIKNELDICPLEKGINGGYSEPLYLVDKNNKYRLHFDCAKCEMSVLY